MESRILTIYDQEDLHYAVEYTVSTAQYDFYQYDDEGNYIMFDMPTEERTARLKEWVEATKNHYLCFRHNEELHKIGFYEAVSMPLAQIKEKYLKNHLNKLRGIMRKDPALKNGVAASPEIPDEYLDNLIALRWRENLRLWSSQWDQEWCNEDNYEKWHAGLKNDVQEGGGHMRLRELTVYDIEELNNAAEYIISSAQFNFCDFDEDGNYIALDMYEEERKLWREKWLEEAAGNYLCFRDNAELRTIDFGDALEMTLSGIKEKYIGRYLRKLRNILRKDPMYMNDFTIPYEIPDSYLDDLLAIRWRENLKLWIMQWRHKQETKIETEECTTGAE